jgi:hypothetical protein
LDRRQAGKTRLQESGIARSAILTSRSFRVNVRNHRLISACCRCGAVRDQTRKIKQSW